MKQVDIENWPASVGASESMNDNAFLVFRYSNDKQDLEKALGWVDRAIKMTDRPIAAELDTKANLLYKLGNKIEGLKIDNYKKMKNGLPTWPTQ
jgi:hypothetical protein